MTTARDLFLIGMSPESKDSVGQGDLSLALAGAELIDLIGAGTATVDGDRIVPGEAATPDDRLLAEAATGLSRQAPYEQVEDWLWRRGRDLSATYQAALEDEGELTRKRSGRLPFGAERVEPADTPARRRAADRWEEKEPVLAALAAVVGIDGGRRPDEEPGFDDEAVTTVVASVHDAVMELEAVRQRRNIENSAFANLWRGP
ncbi:GPP34 family phosphoprotein [Streptomyces sp. NBC_00572]|uniref:GOLPH3/VPS74 family protein n=1 Tax=Streptomyces sp. NBC_00572 TaxID=2903664 RepID=UPI002255B29D|nr:GPP34 family phosphoprotein [Streptomyces sp. NBC_00572]MCX4987091.1 GPP34 family phosphoprotein [Streptomyces sp. NBC_00572]